MIVPPLGRIFSTLSLVGVVALLTVAPTPAADVELTKLGTVEGITEYRLSNGLRVLLFPDSSKPLVTINCTVFVGSRHEGYGETGMAHLLEHLVFKGTPTFPNIPKALRDHGANFNGTTWVDRTNYFETMPASDENLEFGIKLEADRLVNSFIKREDLLSEMTVVRNEFEAGENDPESILSQRMMAVAYEWHNYGKSTIGNRSDIERVPIDNLQAFYRKYYRPDNAMLVVAGKFDEAKAIEYIKTYFGALKKPTTPLPTTYTQEPPQDGERNVVLRRVGTVGALGVLYHIPAGAHPDYAALEILEDILTTEPTGRLYEALVKTKIVSSLSGSIYAWHDPGVLEILATTEPAKLDQAKTILIETLESVTTTPITAEEVDRSKRRYAKLVEQLQNNTDRLAIRLSEWAACGDWRLYFVHRDRIEKVTPEDVMRVAKQYLIRSNRTVGVYQPTTEAQRATIPETPSVAELVKDYKGRATVVQGEAFDPTPENIESRIERGSIGLGIKTALLAKKTRGEIVNLRLNLRYGNETVLKGKRSIAELLPLMMNRGTTKHTRKELQDELDKLSARVGISGQPGVLQATVTVKKANLLPTLALLHEMLRSPSFPLDEFEILKRETKDQKDKAKTEPQALAINALRRSLSPYPPDDVRYVPTVEEDLAGLEAVTVEQVKAFYKAMLGSQAGELVIVGDFDKEPTLAALRGILDGWQAEVAYARVERKVPLGIKPGVQKINTPDKENALFVAGLLFPAGDSHPDYPALEAGNFLFGAAPLASRLSNRVRGEEGLSYGIGSQLSADPIDPFGQFLIFAITNPKNLDRVDKAVAEELTKFLKEGPSLAELNEGKRAWLEAEKGRRAQDAQLAQNLASLLYSGRDYKWKSELEGKVNSLTPEQVKSAFEKYIRKDGLIIIQAGDLNKN